MWRTVFAVLLASLLICCTALADADPASDVLLAANVFYPYGPPVSARLQATLNAELAAVHGAHFPLKVAEIATAMDLGAISQLYEKPRQYAAFLDREISYSGPVPVLVVMPDGYGSAGLSAGPAAVLASLPGPATASGDDLTQAAIAAVRRVAAAAGHPLGRLSIAARLNTGEGGSGVAVPLAILLGACAALATAILAVRRRSAQTTAVRR